MMRLARRHGTDVCCNLCSYGVTRFGSLRSRSQVDNRCICHTGRLPRYGPTAGPALPVHSLAQPVVPVCGHNWPSITNRGACREGGSLTNSGRGSYAGVLDVALSQSDRLQ